VGKIGQERPGVNANNEKVSSGKRIGKKPGLGKRKEGKGSGTKSNNLERRKSRETHPGESLVEGDGEEVGTGREMGSKKKTLGGSLPQKVPEGGGGDEVGGKENHWGGRD